MKPPTYIKTFCRRSAAFSHLHQAMLLPDIILTPHSHPAHAIPSLATRPRIRTRFSYPNGPNGSGIRPVSERESALAITR